MSDHGVWAQPSGLLPNGLLPEEAATATQLLDADRWLKAEEQTAELIARIQPNPSSEERRSAVANYVQRLVTSCLSCKVITFGSVPLKTYLPDGDIDLTAFSDNDDLKDTWATTVCSILENEEKSENPEFHVKEVKYIQAEVKLIKCLVENIVVDISFNQVGGLCTLCFLEEMDKVINRNHLFKRSIILIKAWCYYESRILGAHHGLISTYALETLVLYIFHVFNNSFAGPLEVLYRFLEFFSNFDWDNYCVSLWGPVPVSSLPDMSAEPPRKDNGKLLFSKSFLDDRTAVYSVMPVGQENQSQPFISKHFNVVDPLRTNNNLGRSVSKGNFFRIRSAFTFGAKRLTRLLECPKDSIVAEVNQFFTNTWKRHAIGDRPDIRRMDVRTKQPIKTVPVDEPDNLKFSASGGNSSENGVLNVGEEHLAETGKSSHNSVSEVLSNHHNVNALNNQSAASHVQSQTNHKKQNNSRFTNQVERSHRSSGFVQSDQNQKIFKPNYSANDEEQQSRFQLARTRSSPELTETSSDFSRGRRDGAIETTKVQGPAMFNSGTRRKNLGSDTGSHSSKSSFDDYVSTMQTSSQKNLEVASDANGISNVHLEDFGFTNMREELASVSENLELQQEEQDLVNMMGSSSIPSFNGHISFPMHLTPFHLPLAFSPVSTSMGYGKRNLAGVVPSNLPLIGAPWGSNILFAQGLPSFPVPHYFPSATYSPNLDSVAEPSSDGSAAMEPSVEDNHHGNQQKLERTITSRGFNPGDSSPLDDNQQKSERTITSSLTARGINSGSLSQDYKIGRDGRGLTIEDFSGSFLSKTSRGGEVSSNFRSSNLKSIPVAQASASRSKYPADHWDRSTANTSKSTKDKWSRKSTSSSVSASAYGKEHNRLQFEASSDNISVEVDDDISDWIPLTTMGNDIPERISESASSTSSHARSQHLPGHELSENQSDRVIPFAPVLVGTSQSRALDHSKFFPTFFPAGPLVPYFLLPFGNFRSNTGNPDGYAREFDKEEGPDQLQIISADHNIDSLESHNQSEAVMSPTISRASAPELPEEPNADILNSDLNGHRQNLVYGRFCQNSYHAPFMYAPRAVESPISLSAHYPWDGSGRSIATNLNYTQFMGHNPRVVPMTPLQSGPDRSASAFQRNVDEAQRYRGGTGTYLPNPAPHRDRHSNSRNNRGNRSHDWNGPGDRSRAVDRSHGRSQAERATFRPDRQAAAKNQEEKRWATYKHEPLASHRGPDRTVPCTSSSNSSENAFGMYPETAFRSNGVIPPDQLIPPVVLMYPYDQGVGTGLSAKPHEFGSRAVHRSSGNGTHRISDKVSEGELYNQRHGLYHRGGSSRSSPGRPSSPN